MGGEGLTASGKAMTLEQGQFMGQLNGAGFMEPLQVPEGGLPSIEELEGLDSPIEPIGREV